MKIKDLIKELKDCQKEYGKDFLEWDIYTEQLNGEDQRYKRNWQDWGIVGDSDTWAYFKCEGNFTKFVDKKIFTININY